MKEMEITPIDIPDSGDLSNGKIRLGLSNIHVTDQNILSSAKGQPNLSVARYESIRKLVEMASQLQPKIDLLIFPEVSIPHAYLKLMQRFARMHQIGLIFGMEHRLVSRNPTQECVGKALNHVVTILPNRPNGSYNSCRTHFRLKRYYAPGEISLLHANRIALPKTQSSPYHLFHWRGCYFAIFNCYELTNSVERAWFRSQIDFLIAVEWNIDTNYFSNIAESAARDLHCYFIQVNATQYGDSRIVSPQKTAEMNILRTKGGLNETLLIGEIDIAGLRNFQNLSLAGQKENGKYKMTPPEFCYASLEKRILNANIE